MSQALESPFLRRFDALWARLRRAQWGQALSLTGLLALVGLGLLTWLDYSFELPRGVRLAGVTAMAALVLSWLGAALWRTFRAGTRPRTAAEIERAFPTLGQSVRTTVQFGQATEQEVAAAGVRAPLVAALAEDTHAKSRPLHLDSVIPLRRLWLTLSAAFAAALFLLGGAAVNWEWRVASARTLLNEIPYTQIAVEPGSVIIDQGQPVEITLEVSGRTDRQVTLFTRPLGSSDGDWTEREFSPASNASTSRRLATFVARLEGVKKPLEYRAVAGPAVSETFQVRVRYPLALKQIEVELTPPEYTGHPPAKSSDGNITAVEGSIASFTFELDQTPKTASLVVTDLARRTIDDEPAPETQSLPLEIDGARLTATLPLTVDQKYSIIAETEEGQRLPENSYRIRVRQDQAPEVYFEAPRDPIDVHTLAEVLMRIRVRDDFGLSRAGIVFEVNNEEEYPLLTEDFVTAAEELKTLGKLTPDTQAALEKVLPLEFFQLSQKDSVAYYAFAEDNYPGTPHRTVSDLRFIDIRPFRIQYRVFDPDPNGGGGGSRPRVASLEELIRRQRFNLNRTMNIDRRAQRGERVDLNAIDSLMQSETELANATRELTDFLIGFGNDNLADEIQLLLQAESNMLAAVDSLSAGKYPTSVLQERDALKELIEGRNRLLTAIFKNPELARRFAAADRRIAQKLRRPKSDKQEAEEVVRRLRQLAQQEGQVQMALAGGMSGGGQAQAQNAEPNPDAKATDDEDKTTPKPATDGDPPIKTEPSDKPGDGDENKDAPAQGAGDAPMPGSGMLSAQERRDLQLDIVIEAQDVEKALGNLKNITELAKSRMAEAVKQADGTAGAMERGDTPAALEQASAAVDSFEELAQQVEGLMAIEAAERLAAARNLADELAQRQQQLAMQTPMPGGAGQRTEPSDEPTPGAGKSQPNDKTKPEDGSGSNAAEEPQDKPGQGGEGDKQKTDDPAQRGGGRGKTDERRENPNANAEGLARQAERNAETGKTVVDILQSVLKSTDPADKDVITKVDEILKEQKLDETVQRMASLPDRYREGRFGDARLLADDSADRWEAAALRLSTAFRELSAPKLEELLALEEKLQELRDRLDKLENEADVVQWHIDAGRLMEQIERLKIAEGLRDQLRELLVQAGWTEDAQRFRLRGGWTLVDRGRYYAAPAGYRAVLVDLNEQVQAHIQELILGDLMANQDEATPPQYEQLVERYYQVLATGSPRNPPSMPARNRSSKP
jgi:hypothetical protein